MGNHLIREPAVQTELERLSEERGWNIQATGPPAYAGCLAVRRQARTGENARTMLRLCKTEYVQTRAQAVNSLVGAYWLDREAQRRGISTHRAVSRALAKANSLRARAGAEPMQEDLTLRTEVVSLKLSAATPVSQQEIAAYGVANGDVYYASETRVANILQARTKDHARRALKQLRGGATWSQIQNRYGRPLYRRWSGTKTVRENTAPHDAFGQSLFSAKPHTVAGPVHTLEGWFIFEVTTVKPPAHKGLSPQSEKTVAAVVRSKKLGSVLRKHYAGQTRCDPRYDVPEAPACSRLPAS